MKKRRRRIRVAVMAAGTVAFFVSCGQSLYRLSTRQLDTGSTAAAPGQDFGYDPGCARHPEDPWEPKVRLRKDGFPCLDEARFRPAVDVTADRDVLARLGRPPQGTRRMANVKHANNYWIAEVPVAAAAAMAFELVWFKAPANLPAAHAQMLVKFAEGRPVRLYPQTASRGDGRRPQFELSSLSLSVTGAGEEGASCNLVGGHMGRFAITFGLSSAAERYTEIRDGEATKEVDRFTLETGSSDRLAAFVNRYLDAASSNFHNLRAVVNDEDYGYLAHETDRQLALQETRSRLYERATYRTLTRNCSTSLMDLLKEPSLSEGERASLRQLASKGFQALAFYPPAAAFLLHSARALSLGKGQRLDIQRAIDEESGTLLFRP